ncbi:hypothetical protein [Clostridium moutaii]|uniref:hypothetical protein n=1 Tax=Clostridium moutaii TaxID=3240932 RepID=UPI0035100D53
MLHDSSPSDYLEKIYNDPLFKQYPLNMLYKLKTTEQSQKHHPEGRYDVVFFWPCHI